ncbi:hypothetical protein [Vibrio scophthalmi]|uniref:Bacteriophage lambda head decoration protein D n=1 Tax=Vibrio scophthalmi TaxID=45658 RepID=A0A1E3WI20_9VIBR|nr:hypothetical protein [Vibrio scophthalmi]ODS05182.1 hypothetical protein VSF3289_04323 [Vibrio scophthalmi]
MSIFSKRTEFKLASVVATNKLNQTRNIGIKSGVTGLKRGLVVIIKSTGIEPWDGTAAGKLAITIQALQEGHTSIPCLVTGGYLATQVSVGDAPINEAQKLALMASILFEGQ